MLLHPRTPIIVGSVGVFALIWVLAKYSPSPGSVSVAHAKALKPSKRGELEITDLNRRYLDAGKLRLKKFGRGVAWLDTGTPQALLQAANFVQTIQERQGLRAACPEEISFHQGWIDADQLDRLARPLEKTEYGQYLQALAAGLDI